MKMNIYLVAAVVWIGTVTATLESDSHGNRGNEKNETYDTQHQFSKQGVQSHILSGETIYIKENTQNKSIDDLRIARATQNASSDTAATITPKYFPSSENNLNDLSNALSKEQVTVETVEQVNVGDFGQRIRSSSSLRQRSSENRVRSRQPVGTLISSEDYRKQYRKSLVSPRKLNITDDTSNTTKLHKTSKIRSFLPSTTTTETQKTLIQSDFKEKYSQDYSPSNKLNTQIIPWIIDEQTSQPVNGESKPRKYNSEEEKTLTTKDTLLSTPIYSSTATPIISLGKFSGPIVVPDLPNPNKYSYTVTPNYIQNDEPPKSTSVPPETTTKAKVSDNGYLAPSPIVLNPLQVGVALMNAEQDINSVNDPVTPIKDYLRNNEEDRKVPVSDNESSIQNDAADSVNLSIQSDQATEQEQISEVVEQNSPSHFVEIQKSIEIFHTAPIHEIHYPAEFVPHIQSPLIKHRPQENDFKKTQKGQLKDRKPSQFNTYEINEIVDESVPLNSQERNRYEYNVNDNDVMHSTTNSQVDQNSALFRQVDEKSIFGAREQVENPQYDQAVVKHTRVQGNVEVIPKEAVRNDFELGKGSSPIVTQPSRIQQDLSSIVNPESPQGTQEIQRILLTKSTNEPQSETRLLTTVPQSYPVEKVIEKTVHVPHALDIVEKKVPYPVEKVIEKQITIPQPFPVHVPIDRVVEKQIRIPYPVHVEKVIEKKVPYTIQRLIIPFPIHFRVPQPVPIPIEKIVEKPVPIPVPIEKVIPVEKKIHVPRPYPSDIDKSIERRPYPLETSKGIKSIAIPIYNIQNDRNLQQINRPQIYQSNPGPSYVSGGDDQIHFNLTQYHSLDYVYPNRPIARQPLIHVLPKKFGSYGIQYPHLSSAYTPLNGNNGNSLSYGRTIVEDKIKNEYVGPVPRQGSPGLQSKILHYATPDIQSTLRKTRQESVTGNTGSFRQSKMEYGFKPPMVPSVQYDEQTATKVE